jgi:hypothetical protein
MSIYSYVKKIALKIIDNKQKINDKLLYLNFDYKFTII